MTAYIGFQDLRTLPLKRGDMVKIPKGVVVHTHKGPKVSGRVQVVEVNHILDGSTVFAGDLVKLEDGTDSWNWMCSDRQLLGYMVELNLPHVSNAEFEASKEILRQRALANLVAYHPHDPNCRIFRGRIHLSNPMVRWAGSNKYWKGVDINDVLPV